MAPELVVDGAVKVTEALWLPGVAVPMVGASGSVSTVTEFEAAEAVPVPLAFTSLTVKV